MMNSLIKAEIGKTVTCKDTTIKIQEYLGQGSFGIVYKCQDLNTNETKALKIFNINDAEDLDIAREEALLHYKIPLHRNILEIFGIVTDEYSLKLIFEYCNLGDLPKYYQSKGGKFTIKHQQQIMLQLAEGMAHLHKNNFIHRDIKPVNMLVTTDGNGETIFKLSDFGCGKEWKTTGKSLFETRGGTPCFWAPELYQVDQTYSDSVDVFAMGLIFLAMLNYSRDPLMAPLAPSEEGLGKQPIGLALIIRPDENFIEFYHDDFLPEIGALKVIIRSMIKSKPQDRISAEEVVKKLRDSNDPYIKKSPEFTYFTDNSVFGPSHYTPIYLENECFHSPIHYVMYKKCQVFNDPTLAQRVLTSNSFRVWKSCGRSVKNYSDRIWMDKRHIFLKEVLIKKFTSSSYLNAELAKTKGTELVYAEANIWGIGKLINDPNIEDQNTWDFNNFYGKTLTDVRHQLLHA
ncbi:unnamed protein product [Dimorphilus gyrociliatus]|uniref:Protein kinase domain-containing protein n=1 Tax=Dimorphilus gyrociliatus TaxID=2664684 RepID=A0A7I8VRK4_9ANNE|nr:unnamed protein product [Dimorphilus gyrociliatus]